MTTADDAASEPASFPQYIQSNPAFSYAHSFSINHPLMAEQININHPESSFSDYILLSWIYAHTMRGVEFSSAARSPASHCHLGTREDLINNLLEWLDGAMNSKQRIACLYGPAGVGKSAIAQSVAERAMTVRKLSGATLFLNSLLTGPGASSTRNDPSKLWLTISYRLATKHPSYLLRLQREIKSDPKIVEQSMEHQFRLLITEPIGRDRLLDTSPNIVPILIDGLDQFDSPQTQERMMYLILGFVQSYPDAPLAWIISFRWERYLMKLLSESPDFQELIRHVPVLVDSEEAKRDVQIFMRSKFRQLQWQYDIVEPTPWPVEKDLACLFVIASGLFIVASAIISFCEDSDVADPGSQFKVVVPLISTDPGLPRHRLEQHPLYSVHNMYRRILEKLPRSTRSSATRILGFLLLPNGYGVWAVESTTLWALCNILGISQHTAYACLSKLTAVLDIPSPTDAVHTPIRLLHKSFAYYLLDKEVSKNFWIDVEDVVADLWECHFRIALMQANKTANLLPEPSEIKLSWPSRSPQEVVEFRNSFWENARRMFFHHLLPCSPGPCPSAPHFHRLSALFLCDVSRTMDFDKLVDGYAFPDLPYRLITFLDLLLHLPESHPTGRFIQRPGTRNPWVWSGICFKIQVEFFDDGRITTFKSYTSQELNPPRDIDSSRLFSTREPPEPTSVLQEELGTRENLESITVSGKCHIAVDTSFPRHKFYYILTKKRSQHPSTWR